MLTLDVAAVSQEPAEKSVEEVHVLLRRMVDNVAGSEECRALRRYPTLRRELLACAYRSLEKFKDETKRMVNVMVSMLLAVHGHLKM